MVLTEFHGPKVRRGGDGCTSSTPPGKGGLGKDFDSLTPKHQLRDAKEEYEQAVYRFREAEQTNSPDLIALKREMEFLGCKLWAYRRWLVLLGRID